MNFFVIKQQVNRIIAKKGVKSVFLLLIITLLVTACNKTKMSNALIEQKSIESVFLKKDLLWTIEENEPFFDNQNSYSLRDKEGFFCSMDIRIDDKDREILLVFYYPAHISRDQLEQFNLNILPQTIQAVGELYGNTHIVRNINNELSQSVKSKIDYKENGVVMTSQYKDDYLSLTLLPHEAGESIYKIHKFSIMSHSAHEKRIYNQADYWVNTLKSDGIEIKSSSVSNILKKMQSEDLKDNQDSYFVVNGHLENIRIPTYISEPFKSMSNNFISYNKKGYLLADLVDESESIEIYLSPTALNKNDLKQIRNHYIYYCDEINPFIVLRYSVLDNEI